MMKLSIRPSRYAALFSLLIAGCASSGRTVVAPFDWGTGTVSSYEVVQNQSQTLEIPGQGSQVNDADVTMDISVEALAPNTFKMTITSAEATGSPVSVDPLVGLETEVVVSPTGKITSAAGLEGNAYIDSMGGPATFQESLQELFQQLPEEPLAPGVEWSSTSSMPIDRQGTQLVRKTTETYRVQELTTYEGLDAFLVQVDGDVSLNGSGNQGGQEFAFTSQGKLSGTTYVEATTGRILSLERAGKLAGVIGLPQMDLPITIDIETSVKLAQ
jgi:hypothetical protein